LIFSSELKQQGIKFLHPHMMDLLKVSVQLTNFMAVFIICLAAIIAQKGSDAWWYMTVEDLLPEKYREKASDYEKGTDTMDVWFDSGIIILKCQK
jgi:isoleucyl-tRNA synthetase